MRWISTTMFRIPESHYDKLIPWIILMPCCFCPALTNKFWQVNYQVNRPCQIRLIEKIGSSFKAQMVYCHKNVADLQGCWTQLPISSLDNAKLFQANYPEFRPIWVWISSSSNELLFFGFAHLNCSEFHFWVNVVFVLITLQQTNWMARD